MIHKEAICPRAIHLSLPLPNFPLDTIFVGPSNRMFHLGALPLQFLLGGNNLPLLLHQCLKLMLSRLCGSLLQFPCPSGLDQCLSLGVELLLRLLLLLQSFWEVFFFVLLIVFML